jgi:hypothetical protein
MLSEFWNVISEVQIKSRINSPETLAIYYSLSNVMVKGMFIVKY